MDESIEDIISPVEKEEKKTEINSLDLRFLVKEFRVLLAGGFFKKIYQYGEKSKQFMFEIYVPGKGDFKLYVDSSKIFITEKKEAVPKEPPSFCMFLRKHLMDRRIKEINQYGFDRVLEIKTENNILIFEFLKPGNIILCDSIYNIIMPLEVQQWRYRNIKPKSPYTYPPKIENPFDLLDFEDMRSIAKKSEKKTVVFLATTLGFGGLYAREICIRAGLELQKSTCLLSAEEIMNLLKTIKTIDTEKAYGCIYADTISPFPLKMFEKKEYKLAGNFSAALDEYFSELKIEMQAEAAEKKAEERVQKVERIIEKHTEAEQKWERIMKDSKESAEKIYAYYPTVETILNGIKKARNSGVPWEELKEKIKSEETAADAIKEIREDEGIVVLKLGGKDIEIDIRKTAEENAARYFEDVKWARGKLEGLKKSEEEKVKQLEEVKKEAEKVVLEAKEEVQEKIPTRKKRAKWFEKYRWFITSDGFLVVGGRSAEQNEELVKKHAEDKDWLYHADIHGAAFILVKTNGKPITEIALKEASEFSAACSKAWTRGLGNVDVYAVRPSQATKPEGSLPKGSFVITGDRIWFRNIELKISIGVKVIREEERAVVLSGPVMAIRTHSNYFVTVKPGFKSPIELARKIKTSILVKAKPDDKFYIEQIPAEEFEKALPAGSADITEWGA